MPFMKSLLRLAIIISFLLISVAVAQEEETQASQIQKQAQASCDALIKEDYPAFIKFTYPKVVEAMGGPEKMSAFLASETKKMKADGFSIVSAEAKTPNTVYSAGEDRFCIVPTMIRMQTQKGTIRQASFLVAISNNNSQWTFIDGGGLDTKKIKELFPNFPDEISFPAKQPIIAE